MRKVLTEEMTFVELPNEIKAKPYEDLRKELYSRKHITSAKILRWEPASVFENWKGQYITGTE